MNLYKYLEDFIDETKIQEFNDDIYELALIRYVLIATSKLFYRSQVFFLNDEQLEKRHFIYSQKLNPENITSFEIVCSSYCSLLKEVLENKYNLKTELITTDFDVFQHIVLLLTTKTGNQYLIDPLMDLSAMKSGMKTHNFASKDQSSNPYMKVKLDNLSFLNSDILKKIDEKIGYTKNHFYMDDNLFSLKKKLDTSIPSSILKYDDILSFKIISFFDFIKGLTINGIVDSIIFVKSALKIILNEKEQNQIKLTDFFVDEQDLKNNNIRYILDNHQNRKRGLLLEYNNRFIVFSSSLTNYLEFTYENWEKIKKANCIFVRKSEFINLYHYLENLDLEPNILNHREFLKVFSNFEKKMIDDGKNPRDYVQLINREKLLINGISLLEFTIENNKLILFNKDSNEKFAINYEDEGRNIEYINLATYL